MNCSLGKFRPAKSIIKLITTQRNSAWEQDFPSLWPFGAETVLWGSGVALMFSEAGIYSHTQTRRSVSNWCNINRMNKISLCQTSCHCAWHGVIRSAACHGENMRNHARLILRSRLFPRALGGWCTLLFRHIIACYMNKCFSMKTQLVHSYSVLHLFSDQFVSVLWLRFIFNEVPSFIYSQSWGLCLPIAAAWLSQLSYYPHFPPQHGRRGRSGGTCLKACLCSHWGHTSVPSKLIVGLTVKCDKNSTLRLCWKFSAVYLASRRSRRRGNPITSDPLTGMSGEAWGGLCWLLVGPLTHPSKKEKKMSPLLQRKAIQCGPERHHHRANCSFCSCFNAVVCDPCNILDRAWITKSLSHSRLLCYMTK